jgi:hypothetical protein
MAFRQRILQVSCRHQLTPGYFAVVASCLLLGIVHLVATPHIASLIRHSTSVEAAERARRSAVAPAWLADALRSAAFCGSCCVGAGDRPHNLGVIRLATASPSKGGHGESVRWRISYLLIVNWSGSRVRPIEIRSLPTLTHCFPRSYASPARMLITRTAQCLRQLP